MKTYGYAGQWCHCAKPKRPEGGLVSVTTTTFGTIPKISPTTPDRSVEESRYILAQEWLHSTDQTTQAMVAMLVERANAITKEQTLTAERQKRAEMVREALEEAGNYVDELYQSGNMGKNEYELLTDFFDEKLTQPNNPK